jgi:hypothetical protein
MASSRSAMHLPEKSAPKDGNALQFPEALRNEIIDQLSEQGLGVLRAEVHLVANFILALRDAIVSCEGQKDMVLPKPFDAYVARRSRGNNCRARADARILERRAGVLQNFVRIPCIASSNRWSTFVADVNELVAVLVCKYHAMDKKAQQQAQRQSDVRVHLTGAIDATTVDATGCATIVSSI